MKKLLLVPLLAAGILFYPHKHLASVGSQGVGGGNCQLANGLVQTCPIKSYNKYMEKESASPLPSDPPKVDIPTPPVPPTPVPEVYIPGPTVSQEFPNLHNGLNESNATEFSR